MTAIDCPPAPAEHPAPAADTTADITADITPMTPPERHAAVALAVATVLTGLFAGFFLTYSASVVLGLAQVDDVTYVRSFQSINATIRNATFAVFFFGCVPSIVWAYIAHRSAGRMTRLLLGTALAACASVVVITFAGSVPLNNELATYIDLDASTAAVARSEFESTWNFLNLLRSILAVGGLIAVSSVRRTAAAT